MRHESTDQLSDLSAPGVEGLGLTDQGWPVKQHLCCYADQRCLVNYFSSVRSKEEMLSAVESPVSAKLACAQVSLPAVERIS